MSYSPGPWTPANLPRPPLAWVRADAMALGACENSTVGAYGDGYAVGAFTDFAGIPWQLSSGGSPKMRFNVLNGKPVLELNSVFDGMNTYGWSTSSAYPNNGRYAMFVVWKKISAIAIDQFWSHTGTGINVNGNFIWSAGGALCGQATSSQMTRLYCDDQGATDRFVTLGVGSRSVSGIWAQTNGVIPKGLIYDSPTTPSHYVHDQKNVDQNLYLGRLWEAGYRTRGQFAEYIHFNYGLSADDANLVTNYLRNKYRHY